MSSDLNSVLWPTGDKNLYDSFPRELFFDIVRKDPDTQAITPTRKNIYIYWLGKWWLIGGESKNNKIDTGPNIFLEEALTNGWDTLVLDNNILINTMTLGKASNAPRWKGMYFLGRVEQTTFFPLMYVADNFCSEIIGGQFQFWVKYEEESIPRLATAHATLSGNGNAKIVSDFKDLSIHRANIWTGTTNEDFYGFKFPNKQRGKKQTLTNLIPQYIYIFFNGWNTRKKDPPLHTKESDLNETFIVS